MDGLGDPRAMEARSRLDRQRVAVAAGLRTFLRERTNLVLLVILPPLVLVAFDLALDPLAAAPGIDVPDGAAELGGALFATAFLAGLLGVFQVVGAARSDRRLRACGYHPLEVFLARLGSILLACLLVAVLTFGTFLALTDLSPERPLLALAALISAAVIYGLLGVVIGFIVGRELEASLLLVFLADVDAFAAIGVVPVEYAVFEYLPLAAPHALLDGAVVDGTVSTGDLGQLLMTVAAIAVLVVVLVTWRGELA